MQKRLIWAGLVGIGFLIATAHARAQDSTAAPHRTRLILKDGSYQLVMKYEVAGNVVRYVSAERDGDTEEIPLKLVDLDATHRWESQHPPGAESAKQSARPPALDPELLKEEQERTSLTPEIATDLRLPQQQAVVVLDTWRGTPELVPLTQSDGDLNHTTSHNILNTLVNPRASSHQLVQLRGEKAYAQLHVDRPVLYIRVGDIGETVGGGTPFTVDTGGIDNRKQPKTIVPPTSSYVIVRTDVRTDARVIMSFKTTLLGTDKRQEDVVETAAEPLPGGHWLKVTPTQSLLIGEYALVEVISDREINLGVWDFGVHPTAPENRDALKPEPKRPFSLEHRRPQLD